MKKKPKKWNVKSRVQVALRSLWLKSPIRYAAIKIARVKRGKYKCATCGNLFKVKEINVDHIDPIGSWVDYNNYIEKLFCGVENLQCLCKECHSTKSSEEREKRKKEE